MDANDGVAFWEGHNTWVFASSVVNINPALRSKPENMILRGLLDGHPTCLQAYLTVVVDDALQWDTPQPVRDYTRGPEGLIF